MKRIAAIGLVFAVVFTVGSYLLLVSALAQDPPNLVPYQGKLVKPSDGTPLSGTFAMTFLIYGTSTGGTALWSESQSVPVDAKGLFNVLLGTGTTLMGKLDDDTFLGPDRYLELAIGAETLLPRQRLGSAPYALQAQNAATLQDQPATAFVRRPGDTMTGQLNVTAPVDGFAVFNATNSGTSGRGVSGYATASSASAGVTYGVYGQSNSSSGRGVFGQAIAGSGVTYGVYGQSNSTSVGAAGVYGSSQSPDGRGVQGINSAPSGVAYGVYGESDSANGSGVRGINTATSGITYGVSGSSASPTGIGVDGFARTGVRGLTTTSAADGGRGVWGQAPIGDGDGVKGESFSGRGVYGLATGSSGTTYGVYGESKSTSFGAAGVFGTSASQRGVWGDSGSGVGVYGESDSGTGVNGSSGSGVGVRAFSSSGNLIEAYTPGAFIFQNLRFKVSNSGNVTADGSVSGGGADFAELLPILGPRSGYQPGDVLVMGADGNLALAATPSDPAVVGVYSTQPGFLGGYDESIPEDSRVPLAMAGIVPVKVSAENGAIRVGDLLTSSATLGHAMKATEAKPGTVIGKALEPLAEGKGTIRMLVMLR